MLPTQLVSFLSISKQTSERPREGLKLGEQGSAIKGALVKLCLTLIHPPPLPSSREITSQPKVCVVLFFGSFLLPLLLGPVFPITVNKSVHLQGSTERLPVRILPDSLICNQLLWIQVLWTVS